jgi:uncharacterized membrane protein YfcA
VVPVILGVVIGTLIAAHASSFALKLVFAVVATLNATKLLLGRDDWRLGADLPGPLGMNAYGLGIGVLSALMGIGGGVFGNMILTLYGKPIHRAVATSAGLGVLISIPATIGYVIAGWPKMALLPPLSLLLCCPFLCFLEFGCCLLGLLVENIELLLPVHDLAV